MELTPLILHIIYLFIQEGGRHVDEISLENTWEIFQRITKIMKCMNCSIWYNLVFMPRKLSTIETIATKHCQENIYNKKHLQQDGMPQKHLLTIILLDINLHVNTLTSHNLKGSDVNVFSRVTYLPSIPLDTVSITGSAEQKLSKNSFC